MKTYSQFIAEAAADIFGDEEEQKRVAKRDAEQARSRAARTGMSPEVEAAESKRKAFEKAGLSPEEAKRKAYRNVNNTQAAAQNTAQTRSSRTSSTSSTTNSAPGSRRQAAKDFVKNKFRNYVDAGRDLKQKVGEKVYAEGISEIFINNLQQLKTHSRPIHCSDSKRETLYIKDENQWSKDDEQKSTLTKAIKQVANKNIKQISEWQKQNPKYKDPESKQNDKYMNIVLNSMSGSTNEEATKNYEKIIKNVIKETIIDK